MKKLLSLFLVLALCFAMTACGSEGPSEEKQEGPLDLTGTWKQTNSQADDSWQEAIIESGTITVNWVSDNGDTKSLYWAGSYEAPSEAVTEYVWTSNNDHEQTDASLLASSDDTKDFAYKDGELSYEVSALGTTTTVRLAKQ